MTNRLNIVLIKFYKSRKIACIKPEKFIKNAKYRILL